MQYENYCDICEYYDDCEYAGEVNFCEDCKDHNGCTLRYVSCKAGHDIECNNGFEEEEYQNTR